MKREAELVRFCWAIVGLMASGCVPPVPPEAPLPAAPPALYEEEIKPVEKLDVAIIDLTETPSADRRTITVSGRLVNRGTRVTREVRVHVEVLDKDGAVIIRAEPSPSTETIAPGSTATFSVSFESQPDIDRYHVEAISR